MRNLFLLLFIVFLATTFGCSSKKVVEESTKSQLELRNIQSKTINFTNTDFIIKALVQVLQDDEYTIENLDSSVGYFMATKALDAGKEKYEFKLYDIYYPIAVYKYLSLGRNIAEVKSTISVRGYDKNSKVRASFKIQISKENGKVVSIKTIDDPKFYQEFFAKVDKALFLEKNNL